MKPVETPLDFVVRGPDPLGVRESTLKVMRKNPHVSLNAEAARAFATTHGGSAPPAPAEDALHCTFLPPRQFVNYLLVLESLNFSFWDREPRWRVTHAGGAHDGYWALAAALHRAVTEDDLPVWDARWMANVTPEGAGHLLRGEGRPIPMADARLAHLREAGRVLLERFEGEFSNLITSCGGDGPGLAREVTRNFPSFLDVAEWNHRPVMFHKRAQILVADLARMLPQHVLGRVRGLDQLTAFADYKVPQVLRKEGVLEVSSELAERLEQLEALPAGSPEEVSLRAASIWGCDWIARALGDCWRPTAEMHRGAPTAADVDYLLWCAGQDKTGLRPYHRTRTVFY